MKKFITVFLCLASSVAYGSEKDLPNGVTRYNPFTNTGNLTSENRNAHRAILLAKIQAQGPKTSAHSYQRNKGNKK